MRVLSEVDIAKVCHQVNKAYCESQGDYSQLHWDEAPSWQQGSAISGVFFHINNPDSLPSSGHESWLKQKKEEGWVYGTEKDQVNKTHPCMVPFSELPVNQQAKDYLFKAVVDSLRHLCQSE